MAVTLWSAGKVGPRRAGKCPWGCNDVQPDGKDRTDDRGYCRHLIGWTDSDGLVMAIRESRPTQSGELAEGQEDAKTKYPVEETDTIVPTTGPNPRVYRRSGQAPYRPGEYNANGQPRKPAIDPVEQLRLENERMREELEILRDRELVGATSHESAPAKDGGTKRKG